MATGAETSGVGPERVQELRAEFDVPKKSGGFTTFIIGGKRRLDLITNEVVSETGFAYRSQCEGEPNDVPRRCRSAGGGRARLIEFEIGDEFEQATLVLKNRAFTHTVSFQATDSAMPYPDPFTNDCAVEGVMIFTEAQIGEAEGRVMGRRLSRADTSDARPEMTFLTESLCI